MTAIKAIVAVIHDWGSVASALEANGAYVLDVNDRTELEEVFDHIDGLVLTGGEDINPVKYRAEPDRSTQSWGYNSRDVLEYWAVREARRRRIPILGICRGHQMLNVAHGGTLHQHVPNLKAAHQHGSSHHDVLLRRKSRVARAMGMELLDGVMSLHHQAIDRMGHGLVPVGWSKDGVIEAIESAPGARPYILGTQFHPEIDWSSQAWSYADLFFEHWMDVVGRQGDERTLNVRMVQCLRNSKDYKDRQRSISPSAATGYCEGDGGHWESETPGIRAWVQNPQDPDEEGEYEAWLARNAQSQAIAEDWDEWGDDGPGLRNTRSHRRDMLSEDDGHNITLLPSECDKMCAFPPCASPYDCGSFGDCAAEAVANTKLRQQQLKDDGTVMVQVEKNIEAFEEAMGALRQYTKEGRLIEDATEI